MATLILEKTNRANTDWSPLEAGTIRSDTSGWLVVSDPLGRCTLATAVRPGRAVRFAARGAAGWHLVALRESGEPGAPLLGQERFRVAARTDLACDRGPYARLGLRLRNLLQVTSERRSHLIGERLYALQVCWFRDHVYVLKSNKYHLADVKSGCEFFWDRQQPNGMIWDDVHENPSAPHPSIFGEALGEGFHAYEDDRRWILRRIPCEADVEYLAIEGLYHTWKASGDDAWLARYLPRAERAVAYLTGDPLRWSEVNQLVRRPYTMDSWDFTNPHFYEGADHRLAPMDRPFFHLHSDNSGCYSALWRMAEMWEAVGDPARAAEYRRLAGEFRERANRLLFKGDQYAHQVPEVPRPGLKELVGDDDVRLSLSTGYTINRGLPTHEMAVRILREYQRRRRAQAATSFAEWWTMDPMYTPAQWPHRVAGATMPQGEYMNGAISPIVAGELARAAFEHGLEDYGADILRRLWDLTERDGGWLHDAYRRLPPKYQFVNSGRFTPVDLRGAANRGLAHGADPEVPAWTDEGDNDLRGLPVGSRRFAGARFRVLDPARNGGRAVLALSGNREDGLPAQFELPLPEARAASVYFLHATGRSSRTVVAYYDLLYTDGSEHRVHVRSGHEIGHWWQVAPLGGPSAGPRADRHQARVGWQGPNGVFGNVGVYVFALTNPRPGQPLRGLRLTATTNSLVMVCAASLSTGPAEFDAGIRSYGAPANWAQSSVYHALVEGLAGIVDADRAFRRVRVSPRWAVTGGRRAECTLHYPASDAHVTYRFQHEPRLGRILLDVTGAFALADLHLLLPAGQRARRVRLGEKELPFTEVLVEKSRYVDFTLEELPVEPLVIELVKAGRRA